jgi:glycosyltransferase involved in cell wall biosynthesis
MAWPLIPKLFQMTFAPKRILYCEGNVDGTIGGSYFSLLFLVEHLDRSQFEPIVVFHLPHALEHRFRAIVSDVRILERSARFRLRLRDTELCRRAPVLCKPLGWVQSAVNVARYIWRVGSLAALLKHERIALLHLNNSVTRNHEWMLAAWLTRTPFVTHERGINDRFSRSCYFFAPKLAAIICISGAVRDNLRDHGLAKTKLRVIHNGLDPMRVRPERSPEQVRRAYGIAAGRPVIGMVGNINEWKGQEVVLRALPAIVRRFPTLACIFVGATSQSAQPYEQRLKRLIVELGFQANVVFTGYCSNVADVMNIMFVALHASIAPEPFGRVLLEAMALKKPVVGSRDGAVTEIVIDGETGYTFPPGDSDALAARVVELLEDEQKRRMFGEAGFDRLTKEFHVTRNVERTKELYLEVLDATDGTETQL